MRRKDRGLLAQIEQGALNDQDSITSLLRKCIVLGGRASSSELRDWARKELRGYDTTDGLPEYRQVRGMLAIDGEAGFGASWKRQQISPYDLPEMAHDHISELVPLAGGIAEIEQYADSAEDTIKVVPPGAAELINVMNAQIGPYKVITRLYWMVPRTAFRGVVEQVRTALAELVSEMVALMPEDQVEPGKREADQAIDVVIRGRRNNVTVVNSLAAAGGTSNVEAPTPPLADESWWTRWRKRGLVIGASTVVAAIAGVGTWFEWFPWK